VKAKCPPEGGRYKNVQFTLIVILSEAKNLSSIEAEAQRFESARSL
jgi:hypothetical protein